ncbi:MAG: hypothetical protein JWN03_5572 [Nocardia sp.]|uniref:DUF7373 family lipoprotein n=1 Tax=Nocardia sp. TaxID=1821 RepID=UPI002623A4B5|nr:hypothetical protein [Nocardia sp.]MCU1645297.1 hypothetical protein [Nocardia sp.]
MGSRRIRGAALAIAALVLAGCGSHLDGTAHPGEIDVRTLDVGPYSTAPIEQRYIYYPDMHNGLNLAAMRLADNVVNGPEIDPMFKYGTGMKSFTDMDDATMLAAVARPVLANNGMLIGVSASNADQPLDKSKPTSDDVSFTAMTVVQFSDEAAAAKAATELDAADFGVAADVNQPLTLAKYPTAHAHWRPGVASMGSTLAHGNYIVDLMVGGKTPEVAQLTGLAEKVYDAELPLLDALKPLSKEDALRLPYDPDDMWRRTLSPSAFGTPDLLTQSRYELRGFLNQVGDQDYWTHLMKLSGVDRFSKSSEMASNSMLYRTRDTAAAVKLAGVILDRSYPGPADAPAVLPNAKCGESTVQDDFETKRFRCVVTYRQYVATVESDQLDDAHQRAAAQYGLLANSTW